MTIYWAAYEEEMREAEEEKRRRRKEKSEISPAGEETQEYAESRGAYEEELREAEEEKRRREKEESEEKARKEAREAMESEEMKAEREAEEIRSGEGIKGSIFSAGVSLKKGLTGLFSSGGKKEKPSKGGTSTGRSGSDLTSLMQRYHDETGKWPRTAAGKLSADYKRWRRRRRYTPKRGARAGGSGLFGMGRPPVSTGESDETRRHPLSLGRREPTKSPLSKKSESEGPPQIFGLSKDEDTDANPFKLESGEKKPKNPFG